MPEQAGNRRVGSTAASRWCADPGLLPARLLFSGDKRCSWNACPHSCMRVMGCCRTHGSRAFITSTSELSGHAVSCTMHEMGYRGLLLPSAHAAGDAGVGCKNCIPHPSSEIGIMHKSESTCGAQVQPEWGRNCVDRQHLLQALGQLPAELSGKWSADFAERFEAAWERYEAACS